MILQDKHNICTLAVQIKLFCTCCETDSLFCQFLKLVQINYTFPIVYTCICSDKLQYFLWVPHVEQGLLTLPERLSSHQIFWEVLCCSIFNFLSSVCTLLFAIFLLVIVLSVLRFMSSDYPFNWYKCNFFMLPVIEPDGKILKTASF